MVITSSPPFLPTVFPPSPGKLARFCTSPLCHNQLLDDSDYCRKCGTKWEAPSPASTASTALSYSGRVWWDSHWQRYFEQLRVDMHSEFAKIRADFQDQLDRQRSDIQGLQVSISTLHERDKRQESSIEMLLANLHNEKRLESLVESLGLGVQALEVSFGQSKTVWDDHLRMEADFQNKTRLGLDGLYARVDGLAAKFDSLAASTAQKVDAISSHTSQLGAKVDSLSATCVHLDSTKLDLASFEESMRVLRSQLTNWRPLDGALVDEVTVKRDWRRICVNPACANLELLPDSNFCRKCGGDWRWASTTAKYDDILSPGGLSTPLKVSKPLTPKTGTYSGRKLFPH